MRLALIYISGLTFILYGLLCLMTSHMKAEFQRYGLSNFRQLTGALELLGGIGLLSGLIYTPLLIFSSAGLSLLMLLGTIIRIKVKDRPFEILPAFSLMLINAYILAEAIR